MILLGLNLELKLAFSHVHLDASMPCSAHPVQNPITADIVPLFHLP